MTHSDDRKVTKVPQVLVQDLDGEAVLLNLDNGQYYGLDEVGFRMYQLLVASNSVGDAYKALLEEYEIAPEQLCADLEALLVDLLKHGLVVECLIPAGAS